MLQQLSWGLLNMGPCGASRRRCPAGSFVCAGLEFGGKSKLETEFEIHHRIVNI